MFYAPPKYENPDLTDINLELSQLTGELDETMARVTFAKYLRRNLGVTIEKLTGIKLAPFQIITIKGMLNRNYTLCVWGRGVSKTFTAAVYCILQCLFEPTNILICGPTFRTARFIFNHIEDIVSRPESKLIFDCMGAKIRRNDEFRWKVNNGSIVAIPLNGEKIRGFRANVLVIDEFLLMSEEMVERVLIPYLVAPREIGERIKVRGKENELIRAGKMRENEKEVFVDDNKMIALSSASYKCEYLYRKFESYIKQIHSDAKFEKGDAKFFVSQLGWDAIPAEMMDKSIIKMAQSEAANSANFAREYCARFIDGSDSYFSMNKMIECTVPDGELPHLLLKGDKSKKYILSVDPNASNSPTGDNFAMCVIELDDNGRSATVVHQYAEAGEDLKNHIRYFYYLLKNFNIEMICIDHAGWQFIDAANENELFVKDRIDLKVFEYCAEKDGTDLDEELKKAKREYNRTHQRIVFTQVFTTDFIRKGNEWLQGCFEYKKIWFAGKIKSSEFIFNKVTGANIDLSLLGLSREGEDTKGDTINDFIDRQEYLISNVKNECANIEVKTTAKGTQSFDLPTIMKSDKSPDRNRKDSYTALMLACWAMKTYNDIKNAPTLETETFVPFMLG